MKKLLKVGMDWDDTLCPFVTNAITLCNMENGTEFTLDDITEWGNKSPATKMVFPYYSDIRTYQMQKVPEISKHFVSKLMEIADVYIVTAVSPQFMGVRADQIAKEFPDFPEDHILMGAAKNLIKLDILLDDAPHNILKASATYPVLIRRPWNRNLSGVLSVNTIDEFLILVNQIMHQMTDTKEIEEPCVYAVVGPSGAGKHLLAEDLIADQVDDSKNGVIIHKNREFVYSVELDKPNVKRPENSITDTTYAGRRYTLDADEIKKKLDAGTSVVVIVDISGAIALKREFPTVIIFCRQSREEMIKNVLLDFRKGDATYEQATMQLLSMEQELKNESLCDFSVRSDDLDSILELIKRL